MTKKPEGTLKQIVIGVAVLVIGAVLMAFVVMPNTNRRVAAENKSANCIQQEQIDTNTKSILVLEKDVKESATKDDLDQAVHSMQEFMKILHDAK